jgi:hypothetical protein
MGPAPPPLAPLPAVYAQMVLQPPAPGSPMEVDGGNGAQGEHYAAAAGDAGAPPGDDPYV